jgi:hypothetical protein
VPVPTSSTGSPLLNKSIPVSTSPVIRSGISYQLFSQWSRQTTHTPPSTQTTLIVTVTVVWPPNGHASVASIAASTTQ